MTFPLSVCVCVYKKYMALSVPNLSGKISSISRLLSQVIDFVISERVSASCRLSVKPWPELKRAPSLWAIWLYVRGKP